MKEQHIITNKTARYYTLGELNEQTKQVWFVLHGFGYLAGDFLKEFEAFANKEVFFIAPEALNKYYLKGSGSDVGATWMTKEDRLNEIKDYVNYLEDLYDNFELEQYPQIKINTLGFSQGASTLSRWLNVTQHRVDTAIVYAGEVGPELFPVQETSGLKRTKNYFVYGTADKYFTPELFDKMMKQYQELNFTPIQFEGGHEINLETLRQFFD